VDEFDRADADDRALERAEDEEIRRTDWADLHDWDTRVEDYEAQWRADKRAQAALSERMVCWRCRGTGYVTVAGPDENGLYDADDCPDCGGIPHG